MRFPLELRFKIVAIASQIAVRDSTGHLLCYVKQKAFKLKEAVTVYGDEAQSQPLYRISADRVIDISAEYAIEDAAGRPLAVMKRHGMRSFWRTHYEVRRNGQALFAIREENPWVKVADGIFGELPIIGLLSGYVFNPAYRVMQADSENVVLRVVKRPAFLEGRYQIDAVSPIHEDDERLAVLAVLMMLLLERRRG